MILVTGGLGYIGSHTLVELIRNDFDVIAIDNFSNSHKSVIKDIQLLNKKEFAFEEVDIRNCNQVEKLFDTYKIEAVIHFAALKSVEESFLNEDLYFSNNVVGTNNLINVMKKNNIKRMIFSSSASVYGNAIKLPMDEFHPTNPISPYAKTKLLSEKSLESEFEHDPDWRIICLRYFNPVGAHPSCHIGENSKKISKNIMPAIGRVAGKEEEFFEIFGDNYKTSDGTCIRDYIHIMDLAAGHISALKYLDNKKGLEIINLGTGTGLSVKEIINRFEVSNNVKINVRVKPRREGDVESCYANADKAYKLLNWKTRYKIDDMCRDYWNWRKIND